MIPTTNTNKKEWLSHLYYEVGKQQHNFYLAGTYEKDGEMGFTKWKRYLDCVALIDEFDNAENWKDKAFFDGINQRQILPNEIVLDLEEKGQLEPVINQIKEWGWEDWFVYSTGSRGFHISIFFKEDLTTEEKEAIVKRLGADVQKCSEKNLIALENCPHWKTGKLKELANG